MYNFQINFQQHKRSVRIIFLTYNGGDILLGKISREKYSFLFQSIILIQRKLYTRQQQQKPYITIR